MAEPLPAKRSLTLYRGDTYIWTDSFAIAVPDGAPPGTVPEPMDLTDYDITAQVRANPNDDDLMALIEVQPVDLAGGIIRRVLSATESAKLVPGRAYWDLQLVDTQGRTRTYLAGAVKVVADVSRP